MRNRAVLAVAAAALAFTGLAYGDGYDPAPPPSPWGPGDEAGNTNLLTPSKALAARSFIRSGHTFVLAHRLENGIPMSPSNVWIQTWKSATHVNSQVANQEALVADFGQAGTQLDSLCHFGYVPPNRPVTDAVYYNQFHELEVVGADGLQKCGVDKIKPFFTRGILVDVARYMYANETLPEGAGITLATTLATLAAQGLSADDIAPGDVLIFRTGWERNWTITPGSIASTLAYYKGFPGVPGKVPGLTLEVARWLESKQVAAVGADNWGVDTAPALDAPPGITLPVHNHLLTRGIPMIESMKLEALSDHLFANVAENEPSPYVFAFSFTPVPIKGGAGSPAAPLAIT